MFFLFPLYLTAWKIISRSGHPQHSLVQNMLCLSSPFSLNKDPNQIIFIKKLAINWPLRRFLFILVKIAGSDNRPRERKTTTGFVTLVFLILRVLFWEENCWLSLSIVFVAVGCHKVYETETRMPHSAQSVEQGVFIKAGLQ